MEQVEVRRRIAAPRQEVWDVYTDHLSWARWAGLGSVRLDREGTPSPNGVGCVRVIGPGPFAAFEEVVKFDAPAHMSYRLQKGPLPIREHLGEVDFRDDGDGTLVVWRCRFEPVIPGTGFLFRAMIQRVFRQALEGLVRHRFPEAAA